MKDYIKKLTLNKLDKRKLDRDIRKESGGGSSFKVPDLTKYFKQAEKESDTEYSYVGDLSEILEDLKNSYAVDLDVTDIIGNSIIYRFIVINWNINTIELEESVSIRTLNIFSRISDDSNNYFISIEVYLDEIYLDGEIIPVNMGIIRFMF